MTPGWQGASPYFLEIRPGAGFKTGDFAEEVFEGATAERLNRKRQCVLLLACNVFLVSHHKYERKKRVPYGYSWYYCEKTGMVSDRKKKNEPTILFS